MLKSKPFITFLLIFILLVGTSTISEQKNHYFGKLLDVIADNKNHYLSCEQLPSIGQIDKVVKEHKKEVEQIIKEVGKRYREAEVTPIWKENTVADGESFYVLFSWGEAYPECQNTGRGDIEIIYSAHQDRIIIEKIIDNDTFFGIPYKLKNV